MNLTTFLDFASLYRSMTPCAQLLAAEVACDKCQIQKWTFATVSAAVARSVVCCVRSCTHRASLYRVLHCVCKLHGRGPCLSL